MNWSSKNTNMKLPHQDSPWPVIVLGAAGFVGRHVCRQLADQGVPVIGLGHGQWKKAEWQAWGLSHWSDADITLESLEALPCHSDFFSIVHCAGSGAVSYAFQQPLADYERAVHSTALALEWSRQQKDRCRSVVMVSSAAVYGDQGNIDLVEGCARSPVSPYGMHKLAAEQLCESYGRFFDLDVTVVRLFSVYGEGLQKQLLWDAMGKFRDGRNDFFGTGEELRDWIHIKDAAKLLCAAALKCNGGFKVFNGCHEKASTRQVLTTLCQEMRLPLEPQFNGQVHTGNPRRLTGNYAYAQNTLDWHPSISLAEGLKRYVQWYKNTESSRLA